VVVGSSEKEDGRGHKSYIQTSVQPHYIHFMFSINESALNFPLLLKLNCNKKNCTRQDAISANLMYANNFPGI
jgi:hypothetical protein